MSVDYSQQLYAIRLYDQTEQNKNENKFASYPTSHCTLLAYTSQGAEGGVILAAEDTTIVCGSSGRR